MLPDQHTRASGRAEPSRTRVARVRGPGEKIRGGPEALRCFYLSPGAAATAVAGNSPHPALGVPTREHRLVELSASGLGDPWRGAARATAPLCPAPPGP